MYLHDGYRPVEVAMDYNYDALINICRVVIAMTEQNRHDEVEAATTVYWLLKAIRMKDKEIVEWVNKGLSDVRAGSCPWNLYGRGDAVLGVGFPRRVRRG
jgi:hypothetical protein